MTKEARVKKEIKRLQGLYKDIPGNKMKLVQGLVERAGYLRVQLEDYEKDLDDNGYVEQFTQSENQLPYERKRPVADLYNTTNTNYFKIIKQLSDLMPDSPIKPESDEFDEFSDSV